MLLTEYDREMDIAVNRREAKEEGLEEGMKKGVERGIEEGMEKGMEHEKLVIAKNLLAKGSSAEFVHEITGLPLETIKEI